MPSGMRPSSRFCSAIILRKSRYVSSVTYCWYVTPSLRRWAQSRQSLFTRSEDGFIGSSKGLRNGIVDGDATQQRGLREPLVHHRGYGRNHVAVIEATEQDRPLPRL